MSTPSSNKADVAVDVKGNAELPEIQDIIEKLGLGFSQVRSAILGGGVWLADGAELLLISSVTRAMAKEWQLSAFLQGFIVTVVYLGILIGNAASGPCSQRFGRREMIVTSYSGIFIFAVLSSWVNSVAALITIRFMVGISIGIGQPAWLAISSEITPPYWRVAMTSAGQSLFVLGEIYIAFIILMDDPTMEAMHWRQLIRLGAMPSCALAVMSMVFLNESPTYLASKGRHVEARLMLESMRRQNQAEHASVEYKFVQAPRRQESVLAVLQRQMQVVFGKRLLVPTLVLMFSCLVLNLAYFGCLFAFPQVLPTLMKGRAASELLVGALWELPGLAMGMVLGLTATRKTALKFYLTALTSFILLFIIGVNNHLQHHYMMVVLYIGYYGIKCSPSIGFVIAYQMSAELYPTEARTTGSAVCLAAGRLASMSSPMVYELIVSLTGHYLPFFLLIAGMCLANLYMVDLLPETSEARMQDHEEEPSNDLAEKVTKGQEVSGSINA